MAPLPPSVVGDAYTSTFHWELLEDLVDVGNRMAGQRGEREGAERVAAAFEEVGLRDVGLEEFEVPGWWRESSRLETTGSHEETYAADYQVIALPGTPSGDVEADLVDVGYGRPEDFAAADLEGSVAMASSETPESYDRWIHRVEKYANAVEAGAAAFVFRNHVPGCLPPTGEIGYESRPGPIPAVGVSKETGARIARHAARGDLTARLDVDARNEPATSQNVVGDLGPDTDDCVLVTSHVDAHDIGEGADDNGAGTVLVAEVARLLERVADDLETRVRFVAFGAEEIGLRGAHHAADDYDLDAVECVINLDVVGGSRTLELFSNGFDEMAELFADATDELGVPMRTDGTVNTHGDQWAFVQEGVPAVMASSTSDEGGRGWAHTHADTLDKLDVRDLRDLAVVVGTAALEATRRDREFARCSTDEIRNRIDDDHEQELRTSGSWPFEE